MDHKLIEYLEKTNAAMKDAIVEITTLRARIAELEAERGKVDWKSVDEIVPDEWEAILIHGVLKGDNQPTVNEGFYSGEGKLK